MMRSLTEDELLNKLSNGSTGGDVQHASEPQPRNAVLPLSSQPADANAVIWPMSGVSKGGYQRIPYQGPWPHDQAEQGKQLKEPDTLGSSSLVKTAVVLLTSLLYCVSSGSAILANKHCLVNLKFPFPITLTWLGLLTTTLGSTIAVHTWVPASSRRGATPRYYMTHVMPCGFFMSVAFMTGNLSFLYLTLSFVQMLKSLTPVITMVMLFMFQLEKPSVKLIASVLVISLGVGVAGYAEGHASLVGVVAMLTSIFAESLRLVVMQFLMDPKGGELHPLEGVMYISSACCLWLFAQAMVFEWKAIFASQAYLRVFASPGAFAVSALAGFGVNILAILVIKLASSLTLKVLGTVKDAALVMIGVLLLNETVGQLQLVGYSISLVGFLAYNIAKLSPKTPSQATAYRPLSMGEIATTPSSVVKSA